MLKVGNHPLLAIAILKGEVQMDSFRQYDLYSFSGPTLTRERDQMPPAIQYAPGQRMGQTRLTYMRELPRQLKNRHAEFACDCGKTVRTQISWVRHGDISSCGCLKSELVAQKNTTHSHAMRGAHSDAYRSWAAMHNRVTMDPRYKNRPVCSRWSGPDGFQNFYDDMGDRPTGLTLERVDNDQGYHPGNCKWADRKEQANNTSVTKRKGP